MIDAFVFWIMKGVAELVAVFALLSVFVVLAIIADIKKQIREKNCKHDGGVNETQACDAICRKCLKNLGFIGNYKGKRE